MGKVKHLKLPVKEQKNVKICKRDRKVLDKAYKRNLKLVKEQNEEFKMQSLCTASVEQVAVKLSDCNVNSAAKEAYAKWKLNNPDKKIEFPKVSVENLLLLLYKLKADSKSNKNETDHLRNCCKIQLCSFETFWDSPSSVLKAIYTCILKRKWEHMTRLLLILLQYDMRHVHTVKHLCQIMYKLNPLVRKCGLEDQFEILTQEVSTNVTTI